MTKIDIDRTSVEQILNETTKTATTYLGVPLSTLNTKIRGDVLQNFARYIDGKLLEGEIMDAKKDGSPTQEFDYQRGSTRVEVKSGQLCWNKGSKKWFVKFRDIKPNLYDELCLVLYTPKGLYIFKHNSSGLTTNGKLTEVKGLYLNYSAPPMLEWQNALDNIIQQIGSIFYYWSF